METAAKEAKKTAAKEAKKTAAKEAKTAKRNAVYVPKASGGSLSYYIFNINKKSYPGAAAPPPPQVPVATAKFQLGDQVRTIPDTTTGVHFSHSESVYSMVVLVSPDADGFWYRVQANDCGRKVTQAIPEHRVVALSKAVFDDRIMDTRATVADPSLRPKRHLQAALDTIEKQCKKIKKLKARVTLIEEELAETKALRREIKRMEKAVDTQKASNRILLETARDREVVNIQQVFTRTGPPESASKVTHQLRELLMGKISEERSRTSEVVGLMSGLAEKISTLSASLRSEIQTGLATRKELREAMVIRMRLTTSAEGARRF